MASSDSGNADRVDPTRLRSGKRSFLGHVNTYGSAPLKQTTDLAYYHSNQSAEIAIQGCEVDASDIGRHASKPARANIYRSVRSLKYHTMSVEVISIRLLVREKLEKITIFSRFAWVWKTCAQSEQCPSHTPAVGTCRDRILDTNCGLG